MHTENPPVQSKNIEKKKWKKHTKVKMIGFWKEEKSFHLMSVGENLGKTFLILIKEWDADILKLLES